MDCSRLLSSRLAETSQATLHQHSHPARSLPSSLPPSRALPQRAQKLNIEAVLSGDKQKQATASPARQSKSKKQPLSNGVLHLGQPRPAPPARQPQPNTEDVVLLNYTTGWQEAFLHHSVNGGGWQSKPFQEVSSAGGRWKSVAVDVKGKPATADAPLLEFVLTNGQDIWDKTAEGGNYKVTSPGKYIVSDGQLTSVSGRAVLVVSDLDDTMVGDDTACAEFKAWWEQEAVPRGSRLVYNTGRALEQFSALANEKRGSLAQPDVLISSVGTKIYNRVGGQWVEDATYAAQLSRGWTLNVVREAAYAALAAAGKERMHFRPPEEQNEHKVTCGVHTDALKQVLAQIRGTLSEGGVQARLIVSGTGDWRFLDIVSAQAGKAQAMDYVRTQLKFAPVNTVACGDSGNDIDMLGGPCLAVVVGNAQSDLRAWVDAQGEPSSAEEATQRLLVTRAQRAAGILEGLAHFEFK